MALQKAPSVLAKHSLLSHSTTESGKHLLIAHRPPSCDKLATSMASSTSMASFTSSAQSLALSRSHDASFLTRSRLSTGPRATRPLAGSRLSSLVRIRTCRYESSRKRSVFRHGNLTTCSAANSGEEESVQRDVVVRATRVPVDEVRGEAAPAGLMKEVAEWVLPYLELARLDKAYEGGPWMLFLWPCLWSATLAAENGSLLGWRIVTLFTVSAFFLNGAACTLNDLFDKDFDAQVERCKNRPLVTGVVTPLQAWIFVGIQTLLHVAVLWQLQAFSLLSQFQAHIALELIFNWQYPLAKRWTYLTPASLALAINWGVFLGWSAMRPVGDLTSFTLLPVSTFVAGFSWTLVYETIYGHQDMKEDVAAGVKSLALALGDSAKLWLTGFGTTFIASLAYAGHLAALGWPFYVGLGATATHVAWQISTVDLQNPNDCLSKFLSNMWVGVLVLGAITCGKLLA